MASRQGIWIFIERTETDIEDISLEILGKGAEIAAQLGEKTHAVVIGSQDSETTKTLAGHGADRIYAVDLTEFQDPGAEHCEQALCQLVEKHNPRLILVGATLSGNDLAGRIASRMDASLVSNCTAIAINPDKEALYTKLTHGGRVASAFICPPSGLLMATMLPGAAEKKRPNFSRTAETVVFPPQFHNGAPRSKRLGLIKADPDKIGLDEAEVIVSGGRGMGGKENFELLKALSKILGGAVGASLGAVDEGFAPRRCLVGQTGMTVTPKLYLACGISGSIYHVLGMKDAKAIVAINKDRNADIFKYADMGIVGDAAEIIAAITERLKGLLREKHENQ